MILVLDPPKMENVSSYIMFLLLSDFHSLRKGWYIEKPLQTNPSDVLPQENLELSVQLFSLFTFASKCD